MLLSHLHGRWLSVSAPPLVAMFADGLVVGRVASDRRWSLPW
jgi:hypothetical protein